MVSLGITSPHPPRSNPELAPPAGPDPPKIRIQFDDCQVRPFAFYEFWGGRRCTAEPCGDEGGRKVSTTSARPCRQFEGVRGGGAGGQNGDSLAEFVAMLGGLPSSSPMQDGDDPRQVVAILSKILVEPFSFVTNRDGDDLAEVVAILGG